ncbi:CBS domain-containing protein [Streptomyces sp. NPDC093089]|uniref:CBS domain-containing protein n=1 Tax=Streptomyces sp. NPDC093089 TaxID=3366024 RepID=UPI00381171FE
MTSPAVTVQPDTTVSEAAWLMALSRLKHVPVAEPDGRPVGSVHRHTLLDALLGDDATILEGVRGRIRQVFPRLPTRWRPRSSREWSAFVAP